MRQKLIWLTLFGAALATVAFYHTGKLWATSANGFTSTTLYKGTFDPIDVLNHFPSLSNTDQVWVSVQKTNARSDLYVQQNTWQAGGSTGWHSHPGHSLILVTEGTVTAYEGDDPQCTPHVYTPGMTFVDAGGQHVHIIRNEGQVEAQTIAVQTIPNGAPRRIDEPDPGNCHF
jgi:quercetin dioxygenase-like cupin family protein